MDRTEFPIKLPKEGPEWHLSLAALRAHLTKRKDEGTLPAFPGDYFDEEILYQCLNTAYQAGIDAVKNHVQGEFIVQMQTDQLIPLTNMLRSQRLEDQRQQEKQVDLNGPVDRAGRPMRYTDGTEIPINKREDKPDAT